MKTKDAIDFYGGARQLAEAIGTTRGAVYLWGEDVPELRAYQIEVISGGALRAPVHAKVARNHPASAK